MTFRDLQWLSFCWFSVGVLSMLSMDALMYGYRKTALVFWLVTVIVVVVGIRLMTGAA